LDDGPSQQNSYSALSVQIQIAVISVVARVELWIWHINGLLRVSLTLENAA
jgi:hypothetical protein